MSAQRHVILRQTLELSVPTQADAWPLQQEASRLMGKARALIERCCDEFSAPDRLHRIERLELDLGELDAERLEEQLLDRFGAALRRGLAEQIGRQESAALAPRLASQWELFARFVREGRLPWWADASRPHQPQQSLALLLGEAPELLRRLLPDLAADGRAVRRLAGQFEDRPLADLVALMAPVLADFPLALVRAWLSLPGRLPELPALTTARWRSLVWQTVLTNALRATPLPTSRLDFARQVAMGLARVVAVPYPVLARGWAEAASPAEFTAEARDVALALAAECGLAATPNQSERAALRGTEEVGLHVPTAHAGAPSRQEGRENLGVLASGREAPIPQRESTGDFLRPNPVPLAAERLWEEMAAQAVFSDADAIYLDNAGLVILWPFLARFFERLGFLEETRFRDEATRQRGVMLLQYLASGDAAPPEYLLALNKLLCGMALDEVFELEEPLTDGETTECEHLLEAVIAQVPVLNNMSVQGFRGSFLLRAGLLEIRDGAWLLRVERETHDLVLDRFPWGFQWVKLPWMDAPLQVDW